MSTPSAIPFQDLTRLHASIDVELRDALDTTLQRSSFIGGPDLEAFEEEFAAAVGAAHAVGCNSGTDALSLAMRALGIGPGDEVIVPSMTYVATAEAVLHVGATPVLADVDPETLLLSASTVASVRTARTRAVAPVHLYGRSVDPAALRGWRDDGLIVLEDCAQAHLAERDGVRVGTSGHAAGYSFFPGKNLGAFGDAGAVTFDDAALAAALRDRRIAAAALDVFEGEPTVHPDLLTVPNVVLTPHIASATVATRRRMADLAADNLIAALTGVTPPTSVNPQVLASR
jgi:dTDP-4-amino-4,6-dideoxygalactose transaminase